MKSKVDSDIKKFEQQLIADEKHPIFIFKGRNHAKSKSGSKCIFAFAQTHFCVLQSKKIEAHIWNSVSHFSYKNDMILINFNSTEFIISVENIQTVLSEFSEMLQRILLPTELKRINFYSLNPAIVGPGTRSPAARYKMNNTKKIDKKAHADFICALTYGNPVIQLQEVRKPKQYVNVMFDTIPLFRTAKVLKIPRYFNFDVFPNVAEFTANIRSLKSIEVYGPINNGMDLFVQNVRKNAKTSELSSLSFCLSDFSENELNSISEIITNGPITGLELHRAISPESMNFFYSIFLSPQLNNSLQILNLDRTPNLNLMKLLPKIRNIPFLSLANCDLEIGETINIISNCSMVDLMTLNLSGNEARTIPSENSTIPKHLKRLLLNNISWPDNYLEDFFAFIFEKFENGLSFGFSGAIASTNEWFNLFNYLGTSNYEKLLGLDWSRNPVHLNLFKFMKNNPQVNHLELNGCFNENCQEIISELCEFIKFSPALKRLDIVGNSDNHLGVQIVDILRASLSHKTLIILNVPFSYGGIEALNFLPNLTNTVGALRILNFEGLFAEDYNNFSNILTELSRTHHEVKISFPLSDLDFYLTKGLIEESDIIELKELYRFSFVDEPPKSPESVAIQPAQVPLLNKKRSIFVHYQNDLFPVYMTDQDYKAIAEDLNIIPNVEPLRIGMHETSEMFSPRTELDAIEIDNENLEERNINEQRQSSRKFIDEVHQVISQKSLILQQQSGKRTRKLLPEYSETSYSSSYSYSSYTSKSTTVPILDENGKEDEETDSLNYQSKRSNRQYVHVPPPKLIYSSSSSEAKVASHSKKSKPARPPSILSSSTSNKNKLSSSSEESFHSRGSHAESIKSEKFILQKIPSRSSTTGSTETNKDKKQKNARVAPIMLHSESESSTSAGKKSKSSKSVTSRVSKQSKISTISEISKAPEQSVEKSSLKMQLVLNDTEESSSSTKHSPSVKSRSSNVQERAASIKSLNVSDLDSSEEGKEGELCQLPEPPSTQFNVPPIHSKVESVHSKQSTHSKAPSMHSKAENVISESSSSTSSHSKSGSVHSKFSAKSAPVKDRNENIYSKNTERAVSVVGGKRVQSRNHDQAISDNAKKNALLNRNYYSQNDSSSSSSSSSDDVRENEIVNKAPSVHSKKSSKSTKSMPYNNPYSLPADQRSIHAKSVHPGQFTIASSSPVKNNGIHNNFDDDLNNNDVESVKGMLILPPDQHESEEAILKLPSALSENSSSTNYSESSSISQPNDDGVSKHSNKGILPLSQPQQQQISRSHKASSKASSKAPSRVSNKVELLNFSSSSSSSTRSSASSKAKSKSVKSKASSRLSHNEVAQRAIENILQQNDDDDDDENYVPRTPKQLQKVTVRQSKILESSTSSAAGNTKNEPQYSPTRQSNYLFMSNSMRRSSPRTPGTPGSPGSPRKAPPLLEFAEPDWQYPELVDMRMDATIFKKVDKQFMLDELFNNLSNEKHHSSTRNLYTE
ncbi:hypothetical protein TRFO_37752 [Tritrichomonas foetus]|uniref:Leucine Rich Repeat family protein n=1 Tax=Tritrichomonas foetus TaxID=1144522 RepID=A0A1J4JAA4_9EUKA|nr:hypothetical protein TRFO_37752 [Tritrichomonas foetus]|eukprot:OHS96110.1 hypothetical protein TRFO_37752 [Tritrichomonas foetus]